MFFFIVHQHQAARGADEHATRRVAVTRSREVMRRGEPCRSLRKLVLQSGLLPELWNRIVVDSEPPEHQGVVTERDELVVCRGDQLEGRLRDFRGRSQDYSWTVLLLELRSGPDS